MDSVIKVVSRSSGAPHTADDMQNAADVRRLTRAGRWSEQTSGLAQAYVQGNIVILPELEANDFLLFCQRNPKSCPLLAVSDLGQPLLPMLGRDIDIRTDLPRYRVWRNGMMVDEPTDISHLWHDDLVTFVIGCSFSFEQALIESGISVRHIDDGHNVPMYRSNIATQPTELFNGPMVVSMRPMKAADAIRAIQITSRFPSVHGAPVHLGDPMLIGIRDLSRPDYGDPSRILPDEIPVFWACGVTPQAVIMNARPEFCITHAPGHMLITDLLNHQLASF
jgi:uncharacterized protein YcsI (UPF0317 family)